MSKAQVAKNQKPNQNQQLGFVPANADHVSDHTPDLFLGFPVAANRSRSGSGISVDQITRSYGSGQIGAFRQVLPKVAAGKDTGVSAGCGCGPAGDSLAARQIQRKRPAGVYSCNGTHGNPVAAENVLDNYYLLAHLNLREPKEHHGDVTNQCRHSRALQHSDYAVSCKDAQQCQSHGNCDDYREHSRGLSNENLHIPSVAVNRGVCA